MGIERVDPLRVELPTAGELAAMVNASQAVDAPHLSPETPTNELLYLRFGWENRPPDAVFLARDDSGQVIGRTYVELPLHDNLELGILGVDCHPDHRDTGVPQALLDAGLTDLKGFGRTRALVETWRDGYWRDFYVENGFEIGLYAAQRRLWMSQLDWPELDRLHADARAASADYDLVEVPNPAPDELIAGLLELHRAMNDAPLEDLEVEDEVWDAARSRAWEQAQINRGVDLLRLVAVRRSDGVLGGFTVLGVEHERPTLGFQDDTGVIGEHRGHRLGLRLKIEMLRLLRDRYPQVEPVDTWNAESNGHMIAVNDALGCRVVGRGIDLQRSIG